MAVVVITGGTAGIGRATARAFAERGDKVAVLARGQDGLDGTAKDIESLGGQALAIKCELADAQEVLDAAQRIETELGPIDVWVNSAMNSIFAPFDQITPEEFERANAVTYGGFVNGTRAALAHMKPRNRGTIVQVGSSLAYRGIPLQSAYCGAKHAIKGFTESVRCELLHDEVDIQISMVLPPAVNTPQFGWVRSRLPKHPQPVPPIYQPEVIAKAVVAMADNPRREIWVAPVTVALMLGQKVFPGWLDRYLAKNAWDGQQTDDIPADADREDNIFSPVPGDHGAHGAFDHLSRERSIQLELSIKRPLIQKVVAGVAGAGAVVALAARNR